MPRIVFALAVSLIACTTPRTGDTIPVGPDVVASVVAVFKKSADHTSIEGFNRDVTQGAETSRGTPPAPGVCEYLRVQAFQTRQGYDREKIEVDPAHPEIIETLRDSAFGSRGNLAVTFPPYSVHSPPTGEVNVNTVDGGKGFPINCYSCKVSFDAVEATFCSCITKSRTLLCPNCLKCFCNAPASYSQSFWATAPDSVWARRAEFRRRPESASTGDDNFFGRPVILVIDDDRDVQTIALQVLSSFGYDVALASDGMEGLLRARNLHPDLILTDALLPRLDGRELCLKLKGDPETAGVPIVVMSAVYTAGRYRTEAMRDFAADDFVVKPLDVNDLRETLSRFIS